MGIYRTEATRSPLGLTGTVLLGNGQPKASRQLVLADSSSWGDFLQEVLAHEELKDVPLPELHAALMRLVGGVEGMLRQMEAQHTSRGPSQATELVDLAGEVVLFHDAMGQGYASVRVSEHDETYLVKTKGFRLWLSRQYYELHGKTPGSQAIQDALGVLEGKALFEGPELPVYIRLAEHEGTIFLDVGDADWHVVEITADGWEIINNPPVKFRRSRGLMPLPLPVRGGSLDNLQAFVNTGSDEDWYLLLSWLLSACRPGGPYPVLVLLGDQGNAKSSTSRVLRSLIDPNAAPTRSTPRDERDLAIMAYNSWTVALDNVSHLSEWLSDAVCRLATGGGFSTRELFTDLDEVLLELKRPVILNGIEEFVTRSDLLDRTVVLYLPRINKDTRKAEKQFWADFTGQHPGILGALLDALSGTLAHAEGVTVDDLPRMADFALWATAAEQALQWPEGTFTQAYKDNREGATQVGLESSLLVSPLRKLVSAQNWEGQATAMLAALEGYVDDSIRRQRGWPKNGKGLSDQLRRLANPLRTLGLDIEFARVNKERRIKVHTISQQNA